MKNKKGKEKIIIFVLAGVVIALLVFFLRNVFFPIMRMEMESDFDGAKDLLVSKGVLGGVTVSAIEALQMIVVFIPAEFIQISSGMSYEWYIALALCDIGVIAGASAIYFLVKVFKFDGDVFHETERLEKYEKSGGERGIMLLMYLLFITPIIPFGAICYFASNKKIRFSRYIFTCATGVIPSIITSNVMGYGINQFIKKELPLWALLLIIIGGAAVLFTLLMLVLDKFYFKQGKGTPDSPYSGIVSWLTKVILGKKVKVTVDGNLSALEPPYLVLCNHTNFFDYYFMSLLKPKRGFAFVANDYYFRKPVLGRVLLHCGSIPKKLFYPDIGTIKGIMSAVKRGYPVMMFPEGRLSVDGALSPINDAVVALIKKLGVPLVLVSSQGGYLAKPKWRKKIFRSEIRLKTEEIIAAEEIKNSDDGELCARIISALKNGENPPMSRFKENHKADGLDKILYMCPSCKGVFTMKSEGNALVCTQCAKAYNLNEYYRFDDENIKTIKDYNDFIKAEEKNFDGTLSVATETKIFKERSNKYDRDSGLFTLSKSGVTYKSVKTDYKFEIPIDALEAIAFSAGEEFELYYNNRLHYFYPKGDKTVCARISLLFDLFKGEK